MITEAMRRLKFEQWTVGLVLALVFASPASAFAEEMGAKIGVTVADQRTDANIASEPAASRSVRHGRWG